MSKLANPKGLGAEEIRAINREIEVARLTQEEGPIWVGFGYIRRQTDGDWYFSRGLD